jgi:hypothetical protein
MRKVKVELKGLTPLLMNSPKSMIDKKEDTITTGKKKYDLDVEAEKLAYRKATGELYVPSTAIKGSLINAASMGKIGKFAAKPIIAGGVFIIEQEIGLGTKKYDLDVRTVVIQRARVIKARPCIKDWKISFELQYNEALIGNADIVKQLLIQAGQRVGLLDFRPQKYGSFGMFEVSRWEEVKK